MNLAVLAVAAWRLSNLIGAERGPFALVTEFRARLGVAHDPDGRPISYPDNEIGELLSCPACRSIWAAGLILLLERFPIGRFAVRVLAVSGGALLAGWLTSPSPPPLPAARAATPVEPPPVPRREPHATPAWPYRDSETDWPFVDRAFDRAAWHTKDRTNLG